MLSRDQPFCNPMTLACQAPLSMGFSGKNTGMACHFFLQGIFLTQGSNPRSPCLLHRQAGSLPSDPPGEHLASYFSRKNFGGKHLIFCERTIASALHQQSFGIAPVLRLAPRPFPWASNKTQLRLLPSTSSSPSLPSHHPSSPLSSEP